MSAEITSQTHPETLLQPGTEFDFRDIQPVAVPQRAAELDPLCQVHRLRYICDTEMNSLQARGGRWLLPRRSQRD